MTGTEKCKCGKHSKHPLGAENGPVAQPGGEEGLQEEMMLEADFQRVSRSYTKEGGDSRERHPRQREQHEQKHRVNWWVRVSHSSSALSR